MDTVDERLRQLEALAESIVTTLREERKALGDAKMQFEKVGVLHPPPPSAFTSTQEQVIVADSNAHQHDVMQLDVGGTYFHVSRQTLTSEPDCMLESMFSGRFQLATQADGSV